MSEEWTKLEKEQLKLFRARVQHLLSTDEEKSDHFLMRWLVARDMDLVKGEEMLKKSLEWRKVNGVDGTFLDREDLPDKYKKRFMFGHFGEDAEGYPIIVLPAGRHDHRILLEGDPGGFEACMKWNIVWMEKLLRIIRQSRERSGKAIYQYHEILDLEGYSMRQLSHKPSIEYILKTQTQFEENYPEVIRSVTVINAPKIFPILFALVKPLLSKQTLEKVSIFGTEEEKWKCHFRSKFKMDKFPPRWGGDLKGTDPFCSQEQVWADAPIPLRYFQQVVGEDDEGFTSVKIGARDKLKIELDNLESGCRVEWKFETEVHDIGFGVKFGGRTDLPVTRVTSQREMQEGSLHVTSHGNVTLIFDNKYSYTTPKSLRYKINIIPPPTPTDVKLSKNQNNNLYPLLPNTTPD